MTLATGTRLGSYEILAPLGAGGMGEVYRAKDTKLNREVAIKVLPESLSKDSDALARFEREAHAVAALNHPNILSIHDFGRATVIASEAKQSDQPGTDRHGLSGLAMTEGSSAGDTVAFAVTELLVGETLRARIDEGPLAQRRAVEIAIQIAKGLAAAHEKGIVHRDLKPENVFLTSDSRVKILDFGLAKRIGPESAATNAPTTAGTEPGTVMGTVGYMSPEQVRGRDVDHRTDIFAFGAILYEMLAGRRAFKGNSAVETMNAILKEDPPELLESGRNIAPALDRIVRHCLEKSPESRFHSAGDVAFDLDAITNASSSSANAVRRASRSRLEGKGAIAVGLAALAAACVLAGWWFGVRGRAAGPMSFDAVTHDRGVVNSALFAPDGQTIVYGAALNGFAYRVYLARTNSPESTPLALPDAALLSVSSKGELAISLGYRQSGWMGSGQLARVPLLGGTPRPIVDDVFAADWSPDGEGIAVARRVGNKCRLEYPVGKILHETGGWISDIRFSRDGRRIAFADHPVLQDDRGFVDLVDLRGTRKVLTAEWSGVQSVCWSPKGDEIWFAADPGRGGRRLFAVTAGGRQRPLLSIPGSVFLKDVSADGRILLTREERTVQTIAYLPGDEKGRDLSCLGYSFGLDFSPDNRLLLTSYVGEGSGNNYTTYIRRTDGSPASRLGEGGGIGFSPDGKWVAAIIYTPSRRIVLYPTGTGEPKSVPINLTIDGASWISDHILAIVGSADGASRRGFRLDVADGKAVPFTPEGVDSVGAYVPVTPDGHAAALRGPDGRLALYPFSGGPAVPVAGCREGDEPLRFAQDGKSLFVASRDLPIRIEQIDLATGSRRLWRQFDAPDPAGLQVTYAPAVMSRDGRAVACNYSHRLSALFLGEGVR